jgi:starch phosphorylase
MLWLAGNALCRIHEYKRQLLNLLWCIHRYHQLKAMGPVQAASEVPRMVLFAGKAAPAYHLAKRIIRLIHCVANVVNHDPDVGDALKVVFLPNYNVSVAEIIIPAAELSQQISCAGMEASGTGNMKQAMNGALIIGTLDGANVEIGEEAGWEHLFLFGARASEVPALREEAQARVAAAKAAAAGGKAAAGSAAVAATTTASPAVASAAASAAGTASAAPEGDLVGANALSEAEMAEGVSAFEAVLAALRAGEFGSPDLHADVLRSVRPENDYYLMRQDWPSYCISQQRVQDAYADEAAWTRSSIMMSAGCGKFSSDRTIRQYCDEMWGISPLRRPDPTMGRAIDIDPSVDSALSPEDRDLVLAGIAGGKTSAEAMEGVVPTI